MSLDRLNDALVREVADLEGEGRAKAAERVITGYVPPLGARGPRYRLEGSDLEFIRMNSNSYLSLSNHPALIAAADAACHRYGTGPGAVRFIDGTSAEHVALEQRIAEFVGRPAARAFNSAYTTILGTSIALSGPGTFWIGDELNHNCIIRAMRIANVPKEQRAIYRHNDVADLRRQLAAVPAGTDRVIVIFDGIFSMRGDNAPLAGDPRGDRRTRVAVPRRRDHDDGRLARHRRVRPGGARHRGPLRRVAWTCWSGPSARRSA